MARLCCRRVGPEAGAWRPATGPALTITPTYSSRPGFRASGLHHAFQRRQDVPQVLAQHVVTHEVAYASLLQKQRRALHARLVEAMAGRAGDRLTEQVERLAHHALRGEVWNKALAYCRQAGEKAMARSAYREAVGSFEQALSALPHLPEQHDTRAQAEAYALCLLGEIAVWRKPPDSESAETHYHQALALTEELSMRPLAAHCHLGLGSLYVKTGQPEQARTELSTASELYRTMDMTFWLPQAEATLISAGPSLALSKLDKRGSVLWGQ